jgi:hypothetical protein
LILVSLLWRSARLFNLHESVVACLVLLLGGGYAATIDR